MSLEPAMSLTEQIADHVGSDIIIGRLRPGARIQELKIAGELGVSRGSVREALLILERRHLIEIIPRRGALVSSMEGAEIADFCEVHIQLQSLFFGKLAGLHELQLDALAAVIQEMSGVIGRAHEVQLLVARRRFLEVSLLLLDNFYLGSVLKGMIPASLRVAHLAAAHPGHDPRDTLRFHQALLNALTGRQVERARELVQAYHSREQRLAMGCPDQKVAAGTIRKALRNERHD